MAFAFLDTNVFLHHLRQDDPVLTPKATAIITRIEQGELQAPTSDIVIFETIFTLLRSYKQTPDQIATALMPLIELPGIILPGKRHYRRVFALFLSRSLGFADCYHIVLMERHHITDILTFDTDFDHLEGIIRRDS